MRYIPDVLAFSCLPLCGICLGYYIKYAYVYDNLWQHTYTLLGALAALLLASGWTLRKYRQQQYGFNHFYLIIYGLICFIICGCFMLSDNLAIAFYFGFIGLGIVYIACFSYINLRSTSAGYRPARIAFGNALYFAGVTIGFAYFNEYEAESRGLMLLCNAALLLVGAITNELLQHFVAAYNYKESLDVVFNLLNEEHLVFAQPKAIYAQFLNRPDYTVARNRQWLVVTLGALMVVTRCCCCCIYSSAYMQLMWSATMAYTQNSLLYVAFALFASGCAFGALLLLRYKPKLIYLLFGLIEITLIAAILCVYEDELTEHCFIFLCFLYPTVGVLSSYALHWLLTATPFLYTELAMAFAFAVELCALEAFKFESKLDDAWPVLLGNSIAAMVLAVLSMLIVQFFLPIAEGLIEARNKLLGIERRVEAQNLTTQTKMWHSNYFLQQDDSSRRREMKSVVIDKTRTFQQYTPDKY